MVEKVLLFISPKSNISESDISAVEKKLSDIGIDTKRIFEDADEDFDAIIALGGDGTMLNASKIACRFQKPILSINFGTLGYMCGLEKGELEMLSALKTGFETERRMLIDIKVCRNNDTIINTTALNEAVVTRHSDGSIASLELRCDGATVCGYRGDGVIIATPTGSSGYAMSSGGPIIDTKLDAFCVCPICPHALGTRPMIFSPNSVLEVVDMNRDDNNLLLADGKAICELKKGDIVTVEKSNSSVEIIKLKKDAFYETLYKKMS